MQLGQVRNSVTGSRKSARRTDVSTITRLASKADMQGSTLIEVLVAFLILGVSLLGMVGLVSNGLLLSSNVNFRIQAYYVAEDMAGRMRANQVSVQGGDYDQPAASEDTNCVTVGTSMAAGCDASSMASHDFFEWQASIATVLPNGSGIVCIDSTPKDGTGPGSSGCDGAGNVYAIKLWWDEGQFDLSADGEPSFVTSVFP